MIVTFKSRDLDVLDFGEQSRGTLLVFCLEEAGRHSFGSAM